MTEKVETEITEEVVEEVTEEVMDQAEQDVKEIEESNENTRLALEEIERKQEELFQKEVAFTLKEKGLEQFADVIHVNDTEQLNDVVDKLTQIVNDIKLSVSYVPADNAKQDAYTVHANNKDTKSMIGSKLANLFK